MLIERKIILGAKTNPLMVLEKHEVNLYDYNFEKVKQELLSYAKEKAGTSFTWGYFPGMEKDEEKLYPNCIKLTKQLRNNFLNKEKIDWKLAFIRVASKESKSGFGGLHIDVDIGVGHKRDKEVGKDKEIVRLLINPNNYSRKLQYVEFDREKLNEIGINISQSSYNVLNLPKNIEIKTIEIPPMKGNEIYTLKFWSSLVPHFGFTDEKGHFLIAYGAWADSGGLD